MATVATVFTQQPYFRTPEEVTKSLFDPKKEGCKSKKKVSKPEEKRVWASLEAGKDLFINDVNDEMTLALSDVNLAEISDATRKHEKIVDFLCSGPTALIKNQEILLAEEIENYPNSFDRNLLLNWTSELPNGKQQLLEILVSENLSNSRDEMKRNAIKMREVLNERKNNFPPGANGKYTKEQAVQFAEQKVFEQLCSRAPNFVQRFKDDFACLDISYFRSLRVIPFLSFFRYYLSGREHAANQNS